MPEVRVEWTVEDIPAAPTFVNIHSDPVTPEGLTIHVEANGFRSLEDVKTLFLFLASDPEPGAADIHAAHEPQLDSENTPSGHIPFNPRPKR